MPIAVPLSHINIENTDNLPTPQAVKVGEAISSPFTVLYYDETNKDYRKADPVTNYEVACISITTAAANGFVLAYHLAKVKFTWSGLTPYDVYYLTTGGQLDLVGGLSSGDRLIRIASVTKDGHFMLDICDTGETK